MKNYRLLLALMTLVLALTGCISLAEDITPPPGYVPPTPAPTMGPLFPANAPDLAEGATLYAEKCAPCHGPTGLGDGPQGKQLPNNVPALGLPQFAVRVAPADWYTVVTQGRIDRFMPPFASLTDQQRWNVVAYTVSLSATSAQKEQGAALYQAKCSECHGADGKKLASADLSSQQRMVKLSNKDISDFIAEGIPPAMPALKDSLTEDEIYALAMFTRSLTFAPASSAQAAATPEPATATPEPQASPTPSAVAADSTPAASPEPGADVSATPAQAEPTPAASGGKVTGTIISGSGAKLPADLLVTLHGFDHGEDPSSQAPTETITLTATPAEDGSYAFDGVELLDGRAFYVEVNYAGLVYQSEAGFSTAETGDSLSLPDLKVYEVTEDYSDLVIEQVHLFINPPSQNTAEVYILYAIRNAGNKTIGIPPSDTFTIPFLRIPENINPANVSYEDAGMGGQFINYKDGGFAMPPTDKQYGIAAGFLLDFPKKAEIIQPFALGVKNLSVLVPEGMSAEAEGLVQGEMRPFQNSQNYQTYNLPNVPAGQTVTLTISGEPKQGGASATSPVAGSNQNLLIGLAALGLVLIASGVFLFLRQRNRATEEDDDNEDTGLEDDDPESLMDAIIALDDQYKSGHISEEAYQSRRAELKNRLKGQI